MIAWKYISLFGLIYGFWYQNYMYFFLVGKKFWLGKDIQLCTSIFPKASGNFMSSVSSIGSLHLVKSVQIRSYFWSVFYSVNLRIQPEYREIRTRYNSVFGHFWRSINLGQKLSHCFTCLFPNALYISLLHEF